MVARPRQTTQVDTPRDLPADRLLERLLAEGSWCAERRWEVERVTAPPHLPHLLHLPRRADGSDVGGDRMRRLLAATRAVTAQIGLERVLPQIVVSARDVVGSTGALLAIMGEGGRPARVALVGVGDRVATSSESRCDAGATPASGPSPICTRQACERAPLDRGEQAPGRRSAPPSIAVSLGGGSAPLSNLRVTRPVGGEEFCAEDEELLVVFAATAAAAIDSALASHRERDRIARDLHDHVIGRLFATGMAVQGLGRWITDPAGRRQLADQTDNLDAAIRDLRTLVYGLDRDPRDVWSLGARVRQVIDETTGHLGFAPDLTMDDDLDLPPGSATTDHLLAVLREALANVARHADADEVTITLTGGATIDLIVADDGRGLPDRQAPVTAAGGHGLTNIAERAEAVGGQATVVGNSRGGVTVWWSAPTTR